MTQDCLIPLCGCLVVLAGDPPIVATQALLVDDVQFRRTTSSPLDIGHMAIAVNFSDLATMGAVPVALFVRLLLPRRGR